MILSAPITSTSLQHLKTAPTSVEPHFQQLEISTSTTTSALLKSTYSGNTGKVNAPTRPNEKQPTPLPISTRNTAYYLPDSICHTSVAPSTLSVPGSAPTLTRLLRGNFSPRGPSPALATTSFPQLPISLQSQQFNIPYNNCQISNTFTPRQAGALYPAELPSLVPRNQPQLSTGQNFNSQNQKYWDMYLGLQAQPHMYPYGITSVRNESRITRSVQVQAGEKQDKHYTHESLPYSALPNMSIPNSDTHQCHIRYDKEMKLRNDSVNTETLNRSIQNSKLPLKKRSHQPSEEVLKNTQIPLQNEAMMSPEGVMMSKAELLFLQSFGTHGLLQQQMTLQQMTGFTGSIHKDFQYIPTSNNSLAISQCVMNENGHVKLSTVPGFEDKPALLSDHSYSQCKLQNLTNNGQLTQKSDIYFAQKPTVPHTSSGNSNQSLKEKIRQQNEFDMQTSQSSMTELKVVPKKPVNVREQLWKHEDSTHDAFSSLETPKRKRTRGDLKSQSTACKIARKSSTCPSSINDIQSEDLIEELLRRASLYKCVCGIYFESFTMLMLHKSIHNTDDPFKCSQCNVKSISWVHFQEHVNDHNK